jgi:hypothetical protein
MRIQKIEPKKRVEKKNKKRTGEIITVTKSVRIPKTNIILQAGEKIEVLTEEVSQSITAANDCGSITLNTYESDDGQQYTSGSINLMECMSSGVNAQVAKKALDAVVSALKLQVPEPTPQEVPSEEETI